MSSSEKKGLFGLKKKKSKKSKDTKSLKLSSKTSSSADEDAAKSKPSRKKSDKASASSLVGVAASASKQASSVVDELIDGIYDRKLSATEVGLDAAKPVVDQSVLKEKERLRKLEEQARAESLSLEESSELPALPTVSKAKAPEAGRTLSTETNKITEGGRTVSLDGTWPAKGYTGYKALYEPVGNLGTGTFGKVRLVKKKTSGELLALKEISKITAIRLKQQAHLHNEKEVLTGATSPFIVQLVDAFQDPDKLYMVLEYCPGGEMFTILRKSRRFQEPQAKFYAAQMVLALEHLHERKTVYRDIKPENTLIGEDGYLKVVDFGFAKVVEDKTWTICGTPEYMAPEIILSRGHDCGADWWALGVLIYEMLAGYPPYSNPDQMVLYSAILKGELKFSSYIPMLARDLIKCLMTKDLTQRYGCMHRGTADIKEHPWFKDIDWLKLERKALPAPWVPPLKDKADTSCFITAGQDVSSC